MPSREFWSQNTSTKNGTDVVDGPRAGAEASRHSRRAPRAGAPAAAIAIAADDLVPRVGVVEAVGGA